MDDGLVVTLVALPVGDPVAGLLYPAYWDHWAGSPAWLLLLGRHTP